MDVNYVRVIPRDLFNEAKLLKCLGFLTLRIHDGVFGDRLRFEQRNDLWADQRIEGFQIALLDEGALICMNISFYLAKEFNGREVEFTSPYNSKANFPLEFEYEQGRYPVFNDVGGFTIGFLSFLATGRVEE